MENQFLMILSISLTTSVIIIALIVLGSLINKRYVAKWQYALWIALALRLLVPVNYTVRDSDFQITVSDEVGSLTISDIFETEDEVVASQTAVQVMEPQSVELQTIAPQPAEPDIEDIVNAFAAAYFAADTDTIHQYLVNPYEWTIDVYGNPDQADEVSIIGVRGIPDNLAGNIGDGCVASLEFKNPGENSFRKFRLKMKNTFG